jgi:hypothetical protein
MTDYQTLIDRYVTTNDRRRCGPVPRAGAAPVRAGRRPPQPGPVQLAPRPGRWRAIVTGFDVAVLAGDRIESVHGFLDKVPSAA